MYDWSAELAEEGAEVDSGQESDLDRGVVREGAGSRSGGRKRTEEEEELRRVVAAGAKGKGKTKKGKSTRTAEEEEKRKVSTNASLHSPSLADGLVSVRLPQRKATRLARQRADPYYIGHGEQEDIDSIPVVKLDLGDINGGESRLFSLLLLLFWTLIFSSYSLARLDSLLLNTPPSHPNPSSTPDRPRWRDARGRLYRARRPTSIQAERRASTSGHPARSHDSRRAGVSSRGRKGREQPVSRSGRVRGVSGWRRSSTADAVTDDGGGRGDREGGKEEEEGEGESCLRSREYEGELS